MCAVAPPKIAVWRTGGGMYLGGRVGATVAENGIAIAEGWQENPASIIAKMSVFTKQI